ncbi:MAG: hypothetical protein WDN04_13915 [Rhodospirillales bacterium]
MALFRAPTHVSSISTSTGHIFEVVNGFIDTADAPQAAIDAMLTHDPRIVPASDDDIKVADRETLMGEHVDTAAADDKKSIRARLRELGIKYDGRATLAGLRRVLEKAETSAEDLTDPDVPGVARVGATDAPTEATGEADKVDGAKTV